MVDTHTHLYLPQFDDDLYGESAVTRALDAGVDRMIFPNVDLATVSPMRDLAAKFPENVRCAIGLHPTEVKEDWQEVLSEVMSRRLPQDVAVGEIGIDLYWDRTFIKEQMNAFDLQCDYARREGLPVIIHCREGLDEALEVLGGHKGIKGVFHSFGGSEEDVDKIRRTGDFYFGINGVVTFKNSRLRDTLPVIGLDRILLETDSPYLAPVPNRGKRNESAYLPFIARHIAEHLNIPLEDVDSATTQNTFELFAF